MAKQVEEWTKTAARYRSEPEAAGGRGEGTVELARRAIEEQKKRDDALAKYHHYEVASAAFQIGIVLASATVITGIVMLSYLAGGPRIARTRLHGDRAVRAARHAFVLGQSAAWARRRSRRSNRIVRPARCGANIRSHCRIRSLMGSTMPCAHASHTSMCS